MTDYVAELYAYAPQVDAGLAETIGVAQPPLDDVVEEIASNEPLVSFIPTAGVADAPLEAQSLDAAIFAGLVAP